MARAQPPSIGRSNNRRRVVNEDVLIVYEQPTRQELDDILLLRLGDGVPRAKLARDRVRRRLCRLLPGLLWQHKSAAITSMPQRFNYEHEHTFVSFTRSVGKVLELDCVNDRFVEIAKRSDVTLVSPELRGNMLRNVWQYQGSLKGRNLILLDDVMGSGATMHIAAEILTNAGAHVVPVCLTSLEDEDGAMETALVRNFENLGMLLDVPEIQGSLRETVAKLA